MDEQNVARPRDGALSSLNGKETLTHVAVGVNLGATALSEGSWSQRQAPYDCTCPRHLEVVKAIETESRVAAARGCGRGLGTEFPLCKMKRVLGMGAGDGSPTE